MKKDVFSTENDLFENQEKPYLKSVYFERFRTHLMSVSELSRWNNETDKSLKAHGGCADLVKPHALITEILAIEIIYVYNIHMVHRCGTVCL